MSKGHFLKITLQSLIIALFTFFVAFPAFYPQETIAQETIETQNKLIRRANARRRSSTRLVRRAFNTETSPSSRNSLLEVAQARCPDTARGGEFECEDSNGEDVTVTSSSDCGSCESGDGPSSCNTCCETIGGGGRAQGLCKDLSCNN